VTSCTGATLKTSSVFENTFRASGFSASDVYSGQLESEDFVAAMSTATCVLPDQSGTCSRDLMSESRIDREPMWLVRTNGAITRAAVRRPRNKVPSPRSLHVATMAEGARNAPFEGPRVSA
jgi:hypothetical protein